MRGLKVLVVGSGGREHALVWAIGESASAGEVHAAPGNPGMAEIASLRNVAASDLDGLESLAMSERYDLVVIGPEQPLAEGLGDRLRARSLDVFGPNAAAARLESSKAFAKDFMRRHGVPTAEYLSTSDPAEAAACARAWGAPLVVKASGLAAGKGVLMAETEAEALDAVEACFVRREFGVAGSTVVLERKLIGEEASLFVLTDGERFHLLPSAQDHKRAFDGDAGPNTGGMGAYSPAPIVTEAVREQVRRTVVEPVLAGLRDEGMPYRGLLYVGLMLTAEGPQVLEFNVRFGDPETQAVLPRLGGDVAAMLLQAARGELESGSLPEPAHAASACVVATAADYPRAGSKGLPITGIEAARACGALVFHAGTALEAGRLVTSGGRVLNVVGVGGDLRQALAVAYAGVDALHFEGMRYRRDIGHRALR
jgi:phosphoribosylamine--glycine ligase